MGTITKLGLRKVMVGMFFMFGSFVCTGLAIAIVDGQHLMGALGALASALTATAVGLAAVIYGNIKEHEAKNGA